MNSLILHKEVLSFCKITLYQDYVYVIMNEGVTVKPEHNEILVKLALQYYKNEKFVYITHRINSYSVNPTIYIETAKISNLAGFIVIKPKAEFIKTEDIESLFFNKPFIKCTTIEKAIEYKNILLQDYIIS